VNPEKIREILKEVKDPEIPTISLVDLGIVTDIQFSKGKADIELTPTFAGCPALKIMEDLVRDRLVQEPDITEVHVVTTFDKQWSTDMITEDGHKALLQHGLAPPKRNCGNFSIETLEDTACPFCSSKDTTLNNTFGPTLCRTMHYCNNCKQAFEGFKPVAS